MLKILIRRLYATGLVRVKKFYRECPRTLSEFKIFYLLSLNINLGDGGRKNLRMEVSTYTNENSLSIGHNTLPHRDCNLDVC